MSRNLAAPRVFEDVSFEAARPDVGLATTRLFADFTPHR
jgi:hypothetical protein